jgi:hypothetical protein
MYSMSQVLEYFGNLPTRPRTAAARPRLSTINDEFNKLQGNCDRQICGGVT